MPVNDLRKDYMLDRWVVIAAQRRRRPTDFAERIREERIGVCPFCPGNEHMTPPAVLAYLPSDEGVRKECDQNGFRHKNWLIRCVPNLYPAFAPPESRAEEEIGGIHTRARAIGHHEVIIESPNHDEQFSVARTAQLAHVIGAYIDRLHDLYTKDYVRYVSIFKNYGREAGMSLSHAHTQLITVPFIPKILEEELRTSRNFFMEKGKCAFCDILETERDSPRSIWENDDFMVFAPWAAVHPYEFWIFPKRHQTSLLELSRVDMENLARVLRLCFGGLKLLLNDPPYNASFHIAPKEGTNDFYHWHFEVYPKLAVWAGFEKSTGIFINVVPPEDAAEDLREAVRKEEGML